MKLIRLKGKFAKYYTWITNVVSTFNPNNLQFVYDDIILILTINMLALAFGLWSTYCQQNS